MCLTNKTKTNRKEDKTMTDYKDINIEDIDKVSGGSAPDPSQLRQWPWGEVVEKIMDYVRWYKH